MKKVININFQGRVIPIEESAYELLKNYTDSLKSYFANEVGRDEIIQDIENRIAELLNEELKKGSPCITDTHMEVIIKSIGRPEDFDQEESGLYRVLIVPDSTQRQGVWPEQRFLRQGMPTNAFILLDDVAVGFELWRQLNGFPPIIPASIS